MAKGKYTSKFTSVTAELFNDYYEDTNTVIRRKIASNASSKTNSVNTKQNKAVLSSKPQQKKTLKKQSNNNNKKVTNALKQTASFLNNQKLYQQEFPTLGQSYKSNIQKPQQQMMKKPQQQLKKQQQKFENKSVTIRTYRSPANYTAKQTEELLREFYSLCQSYNGMTYFGKAEFLSNSWSKSRSGKWVNSCSAISLRNAPAIRQIQRNSSVSTKKQMIQQSRNVPVKKQSIKQFKKLSEADLVREFSDICQCFDGMNYFGKSVFQNNSWSKNRSGNWINSCSAIALRNAPVVSRIQRQSAKKQPIKQAPVKQARQTSVRQASAIKRQSIKQVDIVREFSEICQCFDGMNYFGKSVFQKNSWTKNRSGNWINSCSAIALRNAPVVNRIQRQSAKKQVRQAPVKQAPIKKQQQKQVRQAPVKQAPIKKQSIQQKKMRMQKRNMKPVIDSNISKEQQQMNQKCIVAQQNASMKLQNKILKQFREKQEQLEKKKKLEEQQKLKKQQQMKLQQKNNERRLKQQQSIKQPSNLKKQQMEKEKKRVQRNIKNTKKEYVSKRNVRRQSGGMTRSQAKKIRKRQNLIMAINKRISELNAEKNQKLIFNKMVKQKTEQILKQKQNEEIQKSKAFAKQQSQSKLREKEAYEKQKKLVQKKLAKQKKQISQKFSKKSGLEAQKMKQLAELKNKLTPAQFSKIQSIMQQNGNQNKEQNARQLQSEQAKKSWQEQVKKMKARQQEIQQKQQKQAIVKRRFESIKRKLTPKQQENLMKQLKIKEQQKMKKSELKNRQPRVNNNNKKFVKKQTIQKQVTKQQPVRQMKQTANKKQMNKKAEVWTFVNNSKKIQPVQKSDQKPVQKVNRTTKQWKIVSSKPMNSNETRMFNNEFADLCNMFETTKYITYSNYKTWSKNKSGNYISNASVIAARNAPRMTKGLSKQMNFKKN